MKIFKLTLITILALGFANQAFASKWSSPTCPTPAQIQKQRALKISKISCLSDNCTFELNFPINVGTWWATQYWDFFMDFNAGTDNEATSKATAALESLVYKSGPTLESEELDTYFCHYTTSTDANLEATAILY